MIISASRRTDIPAYYTDWFLRRLREGYVLVRNPLNPHQISNVALNPQVVDGLVFWSKNPAPLLARLAELQDYPCYFQFTLNAYGRDLEANLPPPAERLATFRQLSATLGPQRVVWRYDPILLNATYTPEYHAVQFSRLAEALHPYTRKVVFSFLHSYAKIRKSIGALQITPATIDQQQAIAATLAGIAHSHGLAIEACAAGLDLEQYGIGRAKCIDDRLLGQIGGCPLQVAKDPSQRPACGCVASIDIGAYNTCCNGCLYCYANHSREQAAQNQARHDPSSPLLLGEVQAGDKVTTRPMKSLKNPQPSLFV